MSVEKRIKLGEKLGLLFRKGVLMVDALNVNVLRDRHKHAVFFRIF